MIECIDRKRLPELRREILNPWLDEWYNRGGPEQPTFVPYHFLFGPRTREFPAVAAAEPEPGNVKRETKQAVAEIAAHKLGRSLTQEEQQGQAELDAFGLDSRSRRNVASRRTAFRIHQRTRAGEPRPALGGGRGIRATPAAEAGRPIWFRPRRSPQRVEALEKTITEAFVNRALVQPGDVMRRMIFRERSLTGGCWSESAYWRNDSPACRARTSVCFCRRPWRLTLPIWRC